MQSDLLNHIMLILLVVTCTLALFSRIHLPSALGYLVVGIVVGPEVLNILSARDEIEFLSGIGIILMMFMAGIGFSWPKLRQNIKDILGTGAACVAAITAAFFFILTAFCGFNSGEAFLVGGAAAMSSTALVNKQLMEQQEFYASHGRSAFGVALFQDLATLVFLTAIPAIAHRETQSFTQSMVMSLGTMFAVFAGIYFIGRKIERPTMILVGALKSDEIFILTTLLIILGAGWISALFHLPASIGAFLAGMIIGETEFRYKVEEDIRPFRDILMGVFFISIGVAIKLSVILPHLALILGLLFAIMVVKLLLTALISFIFSSQIGNSLRIGLILAHCGEFSLLLVVLGMKAGIISEEAGQILLVVFVLSMMLSTLIILYNRTISFSLLSLSGIREKMSGAAVCDDTSCQNLSEHIILCGFGETGRSVRKALSPSGVQLAVVETDPKKVESAINYGCWAIYGDAANIKTLKSVGIERAKALVITFDDYAQTLKILHKVRSEYLDIPIIVRIHHISDVEDLLLFGATSVLPDGIGTGLSMGKEIIKVLKMPEEFSRDA